MIHVVRRYSVSGLVQGVGFRWFVRECARSIDLEGWVRNEADGSVRVVASGTIEQLEAFEVQLQKGPPASRVDALVIEELRAEDHRVNDARPTSTDGRRSSFQVVR